MMKEMFLIMRLVGQSPDKILLIYKNLYNFRITELIMADATKMKEEIIYKLKINGPSLPVHIAKWIGSSILFTSAFLSELLSEKKLKMSNMRIGSSPLYFTEGQEYMLERFSEHLKSKEKEAFQLLQEKKFLQDLRQLPAIRVALREIKDFAIPFKRNDELMWRFFTVPEADFVPEVKVAPILEIVKIEKPIEKIEVKELEVVKEIKETKRPKVVKKTKAKAKKFSSKTDDKFLTKVKDFLSKNSIDIVNIEGVKKDELMLRVRNNGNEQLLVAYKKKRISDKDIIKAARKASGFDLSYSILSMGDLPKKISDLRDALKSIEDIRKFE